MDNYMRLSTVCHPIVGNTETALPEWQRDCVFVRLQIDKEIARGELVELIADKVLQ